MYSMTELKSEVSFVKPSGYLYVVLFSKPRDGILKNVNSYDFFFTKLIVLIKVSDELLFIQIILCNL